MSHRTKSQNHRTWKERALSLFMAAVMVVGLLPRLALPASAHWADEYLDQLVDWGVIRADQTGNPDGPITRADFAAIVNRAYGYTKTGPIPFNDVQTYDWYYDDISIAYNTGYMAGTSPTTASPNATLTREQAVFILGKNMMLQETPGESLAFSDSRNISTWARGIVKTAVDNYVVSGYPDNSFGPKDSVSKGQMAVLITQCIGTPVQEPGVHNLGGVFGNVTITVPNVTLRDTTISGDLYISGGVGLGGVLLENVTVLGRIIVSSAGESENGDASVVMRNVTADEMLVDSMSGKTVTVRADGITDIAKTIVRTDAYLEDNNSDDKGLMQIVMDDEDGTKLTLAGRIKEVIDRSPGSTVQVAKGTVQKLTIDEEAINSQVILDNNTEVKELNLDVATNVVGQGDIAKLNINAPGSTVAMLPDDIYIRPGLTANIAGTEMDSSAAEEVSRDPRILSGYPVASDVAPTSLQGLFSTNKRGTVYWAVSSISDGSIEADDLIKPPSYGSLAIQNGSVSSPAADTEITAQISGLTSNGSYYLSAVLVDGQSRRSPVKVIAFTTPDNSVPAFAQGYPYMSLITDTMAQVTVMPTKSCKLYYAVLPRGGQAPTANDLKTASVTGNLGYGVVDVVKNTERVINVSNSLEELKDYTLYLWLTDANGMNSSAVQALQFRTEDRTPPLFDPDPDPNAATETETSVTLTAGLNEAGTIYWAVVPEGQAYPLPNNQSNPLDKDNILDENGRPVSAKLDSDYAKLQVENGRSATKRGSVAVRDGNTDVQINVTGLTPAASYDLYYVAKDSAGNYSEVVKKITIRTVDNVRPLVRQYFSNYQGDDETRNPMANSDIILEFSENVTAGNSRDLLSLYNIGYKGVKDDLLSDTQAKEELLNALTTCFKLYQVNTATNASTQVPVYTNTQPDGVPWVNYTNVEVRSTEGGKIEVVFPNGKAVGLASGARYYFEITDIRDNSNNQTNPTTLNPRNCAGTEHVLDYFDTVFALVNLAPGDGVSEPPVFIANPDVNNSAGQDGTTGKARVDTRFLMTPQSTSNADPNIRYELIILTDAAIDYDLYYRVYKTESEEIIKSGDSLLPSTNQPDDNGWIYLGNKETTLSEGLDWDSGTVNHDFIFKSTRLQFPNLVALDEEATYEFAISVTEKDADSKYENWSGQVNFRAYVVASGNDALWNFVHAGNLLPEDIDEWDTGVTSQSGRSIGTYGTLDYVTVRATFVDTEVPEFTSGPKAAPGDTFVDITVALNRPATIYYVIAPRDRVIDTHIDVNTAVAGVTGNKVESLTDEESFWKVITAQTEEDSPGALDADGKLKYYTVDDNYPPAQNISNPSRFYRTYAYGTFEYLSLGVQDRISISRATDGNELEPETEYYIYMVVKGASARLSQVYVYNFRTTATAKPKIDLRDGGAGTALISTTNVPTISADIDYAFFTTSDLNDNPVFSYKLSANLVSPLPDGALGYEDYYKAYNKDANGTGQDYTILDALMATYSGGGVHNGYSVFDVYANQMVKDQVADIIRQSSAGTPIRSSVVTEPGKQTRLDHTKDMNMGEFYYVLAVGHHVSGVTDGYKAVYNIVVPDSEPPRVQSISSSLRETSAGSGQYNGSVTIVFNKPVYWIEANAPAGSRIPVAARTKDIMDTTDTSKVSVYSILSVLGGSLSPTLRSGVEQSTAGQEFTFFFEGANVANLYGTMVVFTGNGRIANASGRSDGQVLTFTLMEGNVQTGNIQVNRPYFTTSYVDSTGRTVTVQG